MGNRSGKKKMGEPGWDKDLLAPCGLYCGVCPMYIAEPQKCGGCFSRKGFAKYETKLCGILKCCHHQKFQRCNECTIFPPGCDRLQEFCTWDSFISHAPAIDNLETVKHAGEAEFLAQRKLAWGEHQYPPSPRKKSITLRHLWHMARPPFRPPYDKKKK